MNGIDNQGVQEMRQLFLKLKDEGKTILLASHNREDIAALCDTTVEIDRGKIVGCRKKKLLVFGESHCLPVKQRI